MLGACVSQKEPQDIWVARVGDTPVTLAEFRDRVAYSPFSPNMKAETIAQTVLQALIAEKMLSACETCVTDTSIAPFVERRRKEAVIETFWRRQIADSITITDKALWQLYLRKNRQRDVTMLRAASREEARQLAGVWQSRPELLRHRMIRDTLRYSGEWPVLEDTVFNAPLKQLTGPIRVGGVYMLFRVEQEWPRYILSRSDFEQRKHSLAKTLRRIRMEQHFEAYLRRVHKNPPYTLNKEVFKRMTRYLENKLGAVSGAKLRRQMERLNAGDVPQFNQTVLTFEKGPAWKVRDFVKELAVSPYPLSRENPGAFRHSLMLAARRLADDEMMYRDAVARGYDKDRYVSRQTAMWRDAYRALSVRAHLPADSLRRQAWIDSLEKRYPVQINTAVLDTVTLTPTRMMVMKKHFPGQTIVPPLLSAPN
ncbi:MAG: hypothetical protein D6677_09035 [Calditrichaeota bacterium]|nr:MAG: hypothetical protein D6677_09035 [Calditrichota bacterium]